MESTFELKSFKLEAAGADVKYNVTEVDDDGVETEQEFHTKIARPVHPDLLALFERDLTAVVADIFDNTEITASLALGHVRVFPDGIAFAGKNDNVGIAITGHYDTKFGKVRFKIPRVKYLTSDADACVKLTKFAGEIVNEVHAYLFENKSAKLETFGEE
jgi:hypothetical protein